jgi:YVTN family beta-propeller protein
VDWFPNVDKDCLKGAPLNTKRVFANRYLSKLAHLGIPLLILAVPLAAGTVRIYVTNLAGTTISVVDPVTNKVVHEISDIEVPESVRFSPDGSRLYITQGSESVLTVLDQKTGKLIKKVPISGHANDLAVTWDGKWILVCVAEKPGAVDFINAASLEKVKSIPAANRMHDVVVSRDDKFAVVTSPQGKYLTVYDLQKQEAAWQFQSDQEVLVPAIENAPDGSPRRIFVELSELNGFAVIDFKTQKEVARITLPDDEPKVVPSGTPTHGLGIAPDGKSLWVVSRVYDSVFAYSLPDLKFVGRAHLPKIVPPGHDPIGGSPNWVTFTPDGGTAYVSNAVDRSVSAVDTKTFKVVARIPMGEMPGRLSTLAIP